MNDNTIFAIFTIGCVTAMQIIAWAVGFNGQVWAFTSLLIGLIAGSILGFKLQLHYKPPTK